MNTNLKYAHEGENHEGNNIHEFYGLPQFQFYPKILFEASCHKAGQSRTGHIK
jgi:hypothetical protein